MKRPDLDALITAEVALRAQASRCRTHAKGVDEPGLRTMAADFERDARVLDQVADWLVALQESIVKLPPKPAGALYLLKNGAVIDEKGQLVVRFVYGSDKLNAYLLDALKNAPLRVR